MCLQKMKVCFVGGVGGLFYKIIFEALALEAVSVVVRLFRKLFVRSGEVSS